MRSLDALRIASDAQPSHNALAKLLQQLGSGARANEPMGNHTSLRVGGTADIFFVARGAPRLVAAVELAAELGVPWRVIGAASNLLIADEGVEGLVVRTASQTRSPSVAPPGGEAVVKAEAGCILASLARQLAGEGLGGLEWAVNVPGTVGAAVVNNSGAFGSSTSEQLIDATLHVPGKGPVAMTSDELGMGYRTSVLKRAELAAVVLEASFRVRAADKAEIDARMRETQQQRQTTQPTGPSLGSMFANPSDDAAGRLIEAAGLKGARCGGAEVSSLHANFMLNRGAARARDVLNLIQLVQCRVWERTGNWLIPEVQLAGRWRYEDQLSLQSPPGDATKSGTPLAESIPAHGASK
jgi:UDP-N-acetylmuramate dehydrogenase